MNEVPEYPEEVSAIYQGRRDALGEGSRASAGDREAEGDDVRVGADTGAVPVARVARVRREARARGEVAVSPGVGFGAGGDGFVRFALVENEHRIGQAVRGIRKLLG